MHKGLVPYILWATALWWPLLASGQTPLHQPGDDTVIVSAGPQYQKSRLHQWLWGRHYRAEWATPVAVKKVHLDTLMGGLTPVRRGGGRQTKNLRLVDSAGKQYVLRSIDKTFGGALPPVLQGTFVETLMNDQVSIAHPYAAITIPPMISAGGVYHTLPQIIYVPRQERLGAYNDDFGDQLFLIEERADEDQEDAPHFGYAPNAIGTPRLFEKLLRNTRYQVDGEAYVRARLYDLFIGDWGRHEGQWRWSEFDQPDGTTLFRPIPRDRDQAYTLFDGRLLSFLISAASLKHLQSFDHDIKDVERYNFPARYLDRRLATAVSKEQWIAIARGLQAALTDSVIEDGISRLPPEVYQLSGPVLAEKLKNRRNHLERYATTYYGALAREVDITGSYSAERFEVNTFSNGQVSVQVYPTDDTAGAAREPLWQRVFDPSETRSVTIYGLAGEDHYRLQGAGSSPIKIRLVGGANKDRYTGAYQAPYDHITIYDNEHNTFRLTRPHLRLSASPFVHSYSYDAFAYDKKGLAPELGHNTDDLVYAGVGYRVLRQQWRKYPFGQQHQLGVRYAFIPRSWRIGYSGDFRQVLGLWHLRAEAFYHPVHVRNYFGVGNETPLLDRERDFYRLHSEQVHTAVGLNQQLLHHYFSLSVEHQSVRLKSDPHRFIGSGLHDGQPSFGWQHFLGPRAMYRYDRFDDPVVPRRALYVSAGVEHTRKLQTTLSSLTRFSAAVGFVAPLVPKLTFSAKTGIATLGGSPEFYQLNTLGGADDLRSYRHHRFYGRTAFYQGNELQLLLPVSSYLYKGKVGLLALYDHGRVWQPGEASHRWHRGYGGGIRLVPFNKVAITATYAVSPEDRVFHLRLGRFLQ